MTPRSGVLLKSLIETGEFTTDDMARELSSSLSEIEAYMCGDETMSLARQLCLAMLIIERSPRYLRQGHALRSQVAAAMAFHAHETAVHARPPIV